jgi:hypothetical protein
MPDEKKPPEDNDAGTPDLAQEIDDLPNHPPGSLAELAQRKAAERKRRADPVTEDPHVDKPPHS